MRETSDYLASIASIFGALVTLLGLFQSQTWLSLLGASLIIISICTVVYSHKALRVLHSAGINVEGRNIDALNLANLRRRLNRSLVVQRAYHLARIEGQDLEVVWQYDGFCRSERETSIEFSIDSENNIAFEDLDCYAYDLQQDPERRHRIQPMLLGADGLSKKIAVPFLKPTLYQQPFEVLLHCRLPSCMDTEVLYYTSTLSFDQKRVEQLAVHLVFVHRVPEWMRVYECHANGTSSLISELRPFKDDGETCEYLDLCRKVSGQSSRIYVFRLKPTGSRNQIPGSRSALVET